MFGLKRMRTLAELEVSPAVYDEIAEKLIRGKWKYEYEGGVLNMTGITLMRGPEPKPDTPKHRPISGPVKKNTAPGAIS